MQCTMYIYCISVFEVHNLSPESTFCAIDIVYVNPLWARFLDIQKSAVFDAVFSLTNPYKFFVISKFFIRKVRPLAFQLCTRSYPLNSVPGRKK